jgi:hypothetical protein
MSNTYFKYPVPASGGGPADAISQLTADVAAGPGPGSVAAVIQPHAVANSKLGQMAATTIKGNDTGVLANADDLLPSQVTAMLAPTMATALSPSEFNAGSTAANSAAFLLVQDITYTAAVTGVSALTIAYIDDVVAGSEYVDITGAPAIAVHIEDGASTAAQVITALIANAGVPAIMSYALTGPGIVTMVAQAPTAFDGGYVAPIIFDAANGVSQTGQLTANSTIVLKDFADGAVYSIRLTSTGAYLPTFQSKSVATVFTFPFWVNGDRSQVGGASAAPAVMANGGITVCVISRLGSTMYGSFGAY